ncbi:phage late control D family protein [Piscinibacter sakaiensis]|uniref:phage late control D family protein n=1 Tax=Piscinibacter sakaiensis TaxID=1547922 RepID=UPI003AAA7D85
MPVATPETPVAQRAAYSARPTLLIDGTRSDAVAEMVRSCVVREAEGGLSSLVLTLSDWGVNQGSIGHLFDAGGEIELGTRLKLYFGETSSPRAVFDGEVHAIEAHASTGTPPEIVFLAEDKLFAARLARRSAVYVDQSPTDVVNTIAERLGLQADTGDLGGAVGTWAQFNESDLAFLRRLLSRLDCDLQISDEQLQVRRISDRDRGSLNLSLYSQLQQVRVIADLAGQATAVTASGFDLAAGTAFTVESTGSAAGPGSGSSGADLLAGLRSRSEHLTPLACANETEARALADAAFDQRARRFVRLHGSTEGNASLRVGTTLNIDGIARRFDNSYAVVEATHRYDLISGYQTDFVAQSAWLAAP